MEHEQHRTSCQPLFHPNLLTPSTSSPHTFRQQRTQLTLWIPSAPPRKPLRRPRITLPN
ncbi:hypothetical protein [Akkermansia glycaniphila]|uniref:Uncharacterized protein n=1 Tax=Akkermansia glycaniphila TaxID=1679444 RepID=A0A1H6KWA2_9BACT|nr:hypothetical protein [Akkermansia glycaniphila]MBT9448720.1 hypothetical protein [Akkermansia glycaniphila]SEH75986.1 Hypothetical protein PYTT_0510 [Akkermansia glycaniphila]